MRSQDHSENQAMDEVGSVNVILRPFDPPMDQPFIYASWRNSATYSVPRGTFKLSKEDFRRMTGRIREMLKDAHVRIACLEEDPQTIIGYSVTNGAHLNWIYVKVEYRKKGIGALLFPKNVTTVTNHLTKIGRVIAQEKGLTTRSD